MKNPGKNSLNLTVGFVSLVFLSQDFSASAKIATYTDTVNRATSGNVLSAQRTSRKKGKLRKPDVIYYPTPPATVAEMLRMARIRTGDVLYDLGSGDGRIPIAAAERYGIRAVGIEIDSKLVAEAEENAQRANVSQLVRFRNEDMFRVNYSEATIVTLYLSEKLNLLLRAKLLREMRAGSRILSHDFRMGDWKPEQTVRVPWGKLYRTIYLWTVPFQRPTLKIKIVSRNESHLNHVGKVSSASGKPPITETK